MDGLDLLRGIAVGLVVLRHALPDLASGAGVVGVVMFFALSGYLITGVLERRPRLRDFYARRALRLVPPLLVLVAGVVLVTLLLDPLGDRDELGWTVLWALTWTGNLPFGHAGVATFHLWTLATEEQFYLVWPAVLLLLGRGRALLLAAVGTALACLATTWWLAEDPDLAYSLPTSWAGCFVVGAAVRLYGDRLDARLPSWAAPAALAVLAVLSVVPLRGHVLTYLAGGPAIAALTGVLILACRRRVTVTGPLRALVALGTVSYAAYLWNYPLSLWLPPLPAVLLTLVAAALSWRYVEAPLQRRWARRRASGGPAGPSAVEVPA
ncbi:acyltransferase family protein [Nocardioides humi]|uniref:Acyltransferase 3 domain-containing protein n=1 Tax=Nocardioides humi TaxID=449461 RepID=A0ABN1ZXI6_9ACTN|nr:acyltransferase [Nocardioides humi]